jgi:hypothetical protein
MKNPPEVFQLVSKSTVPFDGTHTGQKQENIWKQSVPVRINTHTAGFCAS